VLLPLWVLVVALYAARHPITLLEVSSSTADPLP
jgi:hypothetical protein